ncbi:hypothetical protein HK102_003531 [Quaeritorhiza haematococci]|nr:hypothetical protein HK102_003531 [Quaeritorhiza haematococci]
MADYRSLRLLPNSQQQKKSATGSSSVVTAVGTGTEFGVHDTLREGFRTVRSEVIRGHPLEAHLEQYEDTQTRLKYSMYRQTHGIHLPIRLQMERALVSQVKRIPVLPSSNLGLDILMGRDDTIEFEDFLGDPNMSTEMLDVHGAMERQIGMKI